MKLSESIRSNLEERNTKYREVEEIAESALKKIGLDGTRMVHQVANHGSQVFNVTYYAATELLQSNGENVGLNIVFGLEAASEKTTVTAFIQTHPAFGIGNLKIEHSENATKTERHGQLSALIQDIGQKAFKKPPHAEQKQTFGTSTDKSALIKFVQQTSNLICRLYL